MSSLIVEYEGQFYPYVYDTGDLGVSGMYVELWRIVAEILGRKLIFVREINRQSTYSNITAMRTTTRLDGSQLSPDTVHKYYVSVPIRYSSIFFAERQRSEELDGSELTFFTVFRLNSLLLLFVGYVVASVCLILLKNGRSSQVTPFIRQVVKLTTLLSLTMVVFHHAAGFRGNNIIKKPGRQTSFTELVLSLRDGSRSFIIPVPDIFNDETTKFLLDGQPMKYIPDSVDSLRQMCAYPDIATLLHSGAYSEMNMIEKPCRIAEIKPTEVNGVREKSFDSYSQVVPSYYLLPKLSHHSIRYTLNAVIQRMFTQDMIDGFWTRRMAKRLRNFKIDVPAEVEYSPMNLLRLSLIFYIYLVLVLLSLFIFFGEVMVGLLFPLKAMLSRMKFLP